MTDDTPKQHPEREDIEHICDIINKEDEHAALQPKQKQDTQPGQQQLMRPQPISIYDSYQPANKLKDKVVLITGGDSGIGRAVALHCIAEGAKVAFTYLNEKEDAEHTLNEINKMKGHAISMKNDLSVREQSKDAVSQCIHEFGGLNVLVNNIAVQYPTSDIEDITPETLQKVFATNVFSYFYMIQEALEHLHKGDSIINTTSVTAFRGSHRLVDYSATKGALVSLTRSLAKQLMDRRIRVNAVAPGPVWTPLIPASFSASEVEAFGASSPMNEPAQPADIAPSYIFLASKDSLFITGQMLHPNGGEIIP